MVVIVAGNHKSFIITQIVLIRKGNNNNHYLFIRIMIVVDCMRIQIKLQILLGIVRILYKYLGILLGRM